MCQAAVMIYWLVVPVMIYSLVVRQVTWMLYLGVQAAGKVQAISAVLPLSSTTDMLASAGALSEMYSNT